MTEEVQIGQRTYEIEQFAGKYKCPLDDCKSTTETLRGLKQHSAQKHDLYAYKYVEDEKTCEYCGDEIISGRKERKYCSEECSSLDRRERVELECDGCGTTFEKPPHRINDHNYCDMDCYVENSPRQQEGRAHFVQPGEE